MMSKTKTIDLIPGWQFWILSFAINFLVLAPPLETFAQAQTDKATADNVEADLEPKILSEINRVRTTPQDYAQWLETQRQYYDGIWLRLPGEKPVRTNRGKKALEEAIAVLKEQQPLPPLESSSQTTAAATSELEKFANSNNIQYFSYGRKTAAGIVMDLVVDELFPDRRRRQSLLSPEAEDTGVVCKPDPRYAKVCAIAYSNSPVNNPDANTNIASAEPVSSTPNNSNPPENSELPETNPPKPIAEPEAEPKPDAVVAEVEDKPQTDNAAAVTLPVPPQPQAPPTPVDSNESESSEAGKVGSEEELLAQAESEIEQEQQELADEDEVEAEADEAADEEELEERESEIELDREVSEESPVVAEAEVAINTDTAGFSEKVEKGRLEEGDRVIADDGSLYDFYPLRGKAGESFTIYLESDDFDAFVALVDSSGKTVGENDDISQEDSNSQIKVTLPADGVYNVIVNTYDEKGTGEYTLKVSQ